MDIVTGVGVLDKAMVLLRAVARAPLGLAGLQEATGMPRATAHRLATALETHGMLRRDAAGRFELGPGLVVLGRVAAERFPLASIAAPVLAELRDATGESVQLFIRDGDRRRCLVSLESAHALRWIVREGDVLPLEVGSAGRVLAGASERDGWVDSVEEREPGVASVSAPVIDAGGSLVAAISLSGPVERLSRSPGDRFGAQVVAAAAALAVRLP